MHRCARTRLVFAAACGLWACRSGDGKANSVVPVAKPAITTPASRAPITVDAATATSAAASADDASQWDKVKLEDAVPLCVFADHGERAKAPALQDVRKQTLRANSTLVFGTFSPMCLNELCDEIPTQQCWVDTEQPHILVVHSRLSFKHKRGTTCTKDCQSIIAGCETDALKAGKYTVKYGARTFSLLVPSIVRAPCFKLD
jgi:hypothetical protein